MEAAHESERWRQFCIQYAKSIAFNFAESWQQFISNCESSGRLNIHRDDVVEQFTRTISEELNERLGVNECNKQRLSVPDLVVHLKPSNTVEISKSLQVLTFNDTPQSILMHQTSNVTESNSLFSSLGMGSSCSILPIRHRENEKSWRSWSGHGRPASIAETGCLPRSRSEILPCEIASQFEASQQSVAVSRKSKRFSWFRSRFPVKTAVEVIKEGRVRYISGSELEAKQWKKCRLCLMKTTGGYLLEFYSPPRSNRAKSGIFCMLIMEIREATPLEFEDSNEKIFAIRGYNQDEYVIETKNHSECQEWISAIRDCITILDCDLARKVMRHPSAPPMGSDFASTSHFCSTRSLNNVHFMMCSQPCNSRFLPSMHALPPGLEMYPWFHARLSRNLSTRLVLHNGVGGHGLFLVRQSETRPGEFVLTFNCQGKAKHVRILVKTNGECRIHQMIFDTMIDLLEYFRANPLPLEDISNPPMLLNEFVICWRRRSLAPDLDVRDFLTYAGSVRLDIRALEELARHEQLNRHHRTFSTVLPNAYRFL